MGKSVAIYILRTGAGLALFLGILAFAWHFGNQDRSKPKRERHVLKEHFKKLNDVPLRYGVVYPRHWKGKTVRNGVIVAELNQDRERGLQIRRYDLNVKPDHFRDAFLKGYVADMSKHHRGKVSLLDEQRITIADRAGAVAVRYRFQIEKTGGKWLLLNYFYFTQKQVYLFQGGAPRDQFEQNFQDQCDNIVASFKRY